MMPLNLYGNSKYYLINSGQVVNSIEYYLIDSKAICNWESGQLVIKYTTNQNQPKPLTTSQNDWEPLKTSLNHPKLSTPI